MCLINGLWIVLGIGRYNGGVSDGRITPAFASKQEQNVESHSTRLYANCMGQLKEDFDIDMAAMADYNALSVVVRALSAPWMSRHMILYTRCFEQSAESTGNRYGTVQVLQG